MALLYAICVDPITLGHCDSTALDADEAQDIQVFATLRHWPVVGRDDEKCKLLPGDAGDHIVYELMMPRHVDEADCTVVDVRESQINRQTALLFFDESVRIHPGEGLHQGRLTVIHMSSQRHDHGAR
jgi:hypothetical protein